MREDSERHSREWGDRVNGRGHSWSDSWESYINPNEDREVGKVGGTYGPGVQRRNGQAKDKIKSINVIYIPGPL